MSAPRNSRTACPQVRIELPKCLPRRQSCLRDVAVAHTVHAPSCKRCVQHLDVPPRQELGRSGVQTFAMKITACAAEGAEPIVPSVEETPLLCEKGRGVHLEIPFNLSTGNSTRPRRAATRSIETRRLHGLQRIATPSRTRRFSVLQVRILYTKKPAIPQKGTTGFNYLSLRRPTLYPVELRARAESEVVKT